MLEYSACNGCPEIQGSVNAHIVSTSETLSFFQENVIFPSCAQTQEDPEDLFSANHLCFAEKYKFLFCANHLCFHREIQSFLSFLMPLWFMKSWQAEK